MPGLRIALNQINATVGDLRGNAEAILRWTRSAVADGADLVAFPEMALTGYPVEDLALRPSFVAASRATLEELAARLEAEGLGGVPVLVGYLDGSPSDRPRLGRPAGSPQNAVACLAGGRIAARSAKHHLPNYGVFDEYRYFVPGDSLQVVRVRGIDVAVAVCEDLWQDGGPVAAVRGAQAGLLVTVNASPYEAGKTGERLALVRKRAGEAGCPLAYVNMVGGQDELVFDGGSMVVDSDGTLLARVPQFTETTLLLDLDLPAATTAVADPALSDGVAHGVDGITINATELPTPTLPRSADRAPLAPPEVAPDLDRLAEIYQALVTGLGDYVRKNGFRSVILGLSGGIDSALTAAIAADAIGADNVHGVSMPSRYSSDHSKDDAADSAQRIGLHYGVVEIAPMVEAFHTQLELTGLAEENLQARVRGTTLMGLSNQHGHLVLATGNKSELAVGYSTLYGDAVGGFAPLKDLPKTVVWELARWRNEDAAARGETPPVPENSITKPPSAELRPGQQDTDSLPDYHLLDDILDDYVEQDLGRERIVAAGFDEDLVEHVLRLVDTAEYKRRQYPPGPKISLKAFGRDRRLPITNRWRETDPDRATQPDPTARAAQ